MGKRHETILYIMCSELHKYNTRWKDSEELCPNGCPPRALLWARAPSPRRPDGDTQAQTPARDDQRAAVGGPNAEGSGKRGRLKARGAVLPSSPNRDIRTPGLSGAWRGRNWTQPCASQPGAAPRHAEPSSTTVSSEHATPSQSGTQLPGSPCWPQHRLRGHLLPPPPLDSPHTVTPPPGSQELPWPPSPAVPRGGTGTSRAHPRPWAPSRG